MSLVSKQYARNKLQPWLVCFSAALFFFYLVLQLAVFNTIGGDLMRDFGIHATILSQLAATYFYTCSLFFLPTGLLFDRFSTKTLLVIAALLCVAGTALIAITPLLSMAFLGRILVGISNPFSFLGPMRLVARWFPKERAAFIVGLIFTMGMSGGIVAQSPFEFLMHFVGGWRNAMLINAAFGLLITFIMVIFIKDHPIKSFEKPIKKINQTRISFMHSIKLACGKKQNWLCSLYTGLMNLPVPTLGALWGNLYLVQSKGYSSIAAGNLVSFIFVGLILGSPLIGWVSDKLENRKLPMLVSAVCILLCAIAIIYLQTSFFALATLFFILGFFSGAQTISYPVVIESNSPAIESTALAFIAFVVNLIGAGSQIILGLLINLHWTGNLINGIPFYTANDFKFSLTLLPIGLILSLLASIWIRETFNKNI